MNPPLISDLDWAGKRPVGLMRGLSEAPGPAERAEKLGFIDALLCLFRWHLFRGTHFGVMI
jgi:hypothetical protein